jgi:hypothetical protein
MVTTFLIISDKRSGAEEVMQGNGVADDTTRGKGGADDSRHVEELPH